MSGGRWGYRNDYLCNDMFCESADYGFERRKHYKYRVIRARVTDPMEDKELSELVYDVFCLIHSADWYQSSDTCEETYRADVEYFKNKWLKTTAKQRAKREIDKAIEQAKDELYKTFGVEVADENL